MRLHFRALVGLALVLASVAYGPQIRFTRGTTATPVSLPESVRNLMTSDPVFVLSTDRWLEFDLPDHMTATRIMTNACLKDSVRQLSDEEVLAAEWNYRIRYELRGRSDDIVDSGVYSFRTKLDRYRNPQSDDVYSARFYDGHPGQIAVTQDMLLDRESFAQAPQSLRLKLESSASEIHEVVVRTNGRLERPDSQLSLLWQRMNLERRDQLASASVYPQGLLTRRQQFNLLRAVWAPFAPVGYPGFGYTQRTLLTVREMERFMIRETPEPAGFVVHENLVGMLPVPIEPGRMEIELATIPTGIKTAWPESVEFHWYGHRIHERSTTTIRLEGPAETRVANPVEVPNASTITATLLESNGLNRSRRWKCELASIDGVYELRSRVPLIVRAYWRPLESSNVNVEPLEITPLPAFLRTYATTEDQPVDFPVAHLAGYTTTVQVSLRAAAGRARCIPPREGSDVRRQLVDMNQLFVAPEGEIPSIVYATIEWRFLDADGKIVRRGVVTGEAPWSMHDRLASGVLTTQVSEPLIYFFEVPRDVVRLQVVTFGVPLFVSMTSRPPDVARVTEIPEDYSAFARKATDNRSWFAVRATQHNDFLEIGQSPLLIAQPRPPGDDPDLIAGRYLWEDFLPHGDWRARFVLTPLEPDQPIAVESAPLAFHDLPRNVAQKLRMLVDSGKRTVTPSLMYRFESSPPSTLVVWLNGQIHHRVEPQSAVGEVVLPPWIIDNPEATVRIDCAVPVQLWMSRIEPHDTTSKTWLKRLAVEFDRPTLEFTYHKLSSAPERMSVLVFRALNDPRVTNRTQLRVTLAAKSESGETAPVTEYTLRERLFSLAQPEGPPTLMLPEISDAPRDAGRACLIPLGDDLPAGDYLVRISRDVASPGTTENRMFVIVSRTTPGEFDFRELSIEIVPEFEP